MTLVVAYGLIFTSALLSGVVLGVLIHIYGKGNG